MNAKSYSRQSRLLMALLVVMSIAMFAVISFHLHSLENHVQNSPSSREETIAKAGFENHSDSFQSKLEVGVNTTNINSLNATIPKITKQRGSLIADLEVARISEEQRHSIKIFINKSHELPKSRHNSNVRLHTVTYASHHSIDDRFCRALESALRYHHPIIVLGWGLPWKGLSQKLVAAYDFAASLPEEDLMLFTDAFDVAFTNTPAYIQETFLTHHYDILFAAECGCWPHLIIDKDICQHDYPASPTPYRFLNSGTWIGSVSKMKKLLLDVLMEIDGNFTLSNDQKLIADFFLYRNRQYNISLDYHARIFQSMHRSNESSDQDCDPFGDMVLTKEKEWMNKRTETIPAVLHFNGGGKKHHIRMLEKVWYHTAEYYHARTYREVKKGARKLPGADKDGGGRLEDHRVHIVGK